MDSNPRILLWNYTYEEMLEMDRFFQACNAPLVQAIESDQGNLLVHEILFTEKRTDQRFACNEKIMLFFNVDAPMIHTIMGESKKWDIPRPIYAIVTPQSIEWTFSDLADHLIKERDFIKKRMEEEKNKGPSSDVH
jgi:hypothetical protein